MEKLVAVGPYSPAMRRSIEKYLPEGIALSYITQKSQYGELCDADYILLRTLRLERADIRTLQKARLIQRWGAGYDSVDIHAAGELGIQVAVGAGVNAQSVAELTVLLMLAVCRNLIAQVDAFADGKDCRVAYAANSCCIHGKTVGIFGMGSIGKKVAAIVRGFGAQVIYYDVYRMSDEQEEALGCRFADEDEVLRTADIVSLHLPLLESTAGYLNAERIAKMKPGAVLVNAARQELVNEQALAQALLDGKLLGAGLDEIAQPYAQSPFAGMQNVICTPHIGGSTVDINDAMAKICMEHVLSVQHGELLTRPGLVNAEYFK